ncbi:DUF4169 family protein [Aurantimonas sp. MSK8Z-1]|uniref:DUF4169 family protein n=1 Tax=Mangrovibrevibacter kandeliae TaxID=2968473 RepID=UPI002119AF8F|nr:DUF4169 family protein [Aurantimonas sp. MSK8Z-1]MCW4116750.1 DUF4169 family protein [Aurantimonas sp. MSK8Z-1]
MGEVVNLRQARKAAGRRLKDEQAAQNRAKHGLGKAEKRQRKTEDAARERQLDGHRLDRDGPSEPESGSQSCNR